MDDVIASFHRCRHGGDAFVDTFYDLFLSKSPAVREKFANTNFHIQKLMLRESLLEMMLFEQGASGSEKVVQKLGKHHHEMGIPDKMYQMWLDSLCEAVAKHDPEFSPELETRWREAMQLGIDVMIRCNHPPQ